MVYLVLGENKITPNFKGALCRDLSVFLRKPAGYGYGIVLIHGTLGY